MFELTVNGKIKSADQSDYIRNKLAFQFYISLQIVSLLNFIGKKIRLHHELN